MFNEFNLKVTKPQLFACVCELQDDGFGNLVKCNNFMQLWHFLEDENE